MRPLRSAFAALAFASSLCASAREANALERQHHIGLDPSLAMLKVDDKSTMSVGAGLGLHYTYGFNDQWNLLVELNASRVAAHQDQDGATSPHTRPSDVAHASAGVGYVIDVLQFVPYIGLMLGGYRLSGGTLDSPLVLPGAELAVGLDYELNRHWAVGLAGRQHLLFTKASTYPSYTTVMLRLEYMWGF